MIRQRNPPISTTIRFHYRMVDIVSAGGLVWWAFALALPNDTFATSSSYAGLAHIRSEGVWAAVAGAIAVLYLVALASQSRALRLIAVSAAGMFWWLVSGSIFYIAPTSTGIGLYLLLGIVMALRFAEEWTPRS